MKFFTRALPMLLFSLPAFAVIDLSLGNVVDLVVSLLIVAAVFGVLAWLIGFVTSKFPKLAPFSDGLFVILAILGALILINVLLSFAGHPVVAVHS